MSCLGVCRIIRVIRVIIMGVCRCIPSPARAFLLINLAWRVGVEVEVGIGVVGGVWGREKEWARGNYEKRGKGRGWVIRGGGCNLRARNIEETFRCRDDML